MKPIKARLTVEGTTKLLQAALPETIEIRPDVRSESAVLGNPTEIHRIVASLCANAILATHGQAGTLEVGIRGC